MGSFKLPIKLPTKLSEVITSLGISLPFTLPTALTTDSSDTGDEKYTAGITLPIQLPTSLTTVSKDDDDQYVKGIQLPITLPFSFDYINKDDIYTSVRLPITQTPSAAEDGTVYLKITEIPSGYPKYLPISETVWGFEGLLVDETIVSKYSDSLLVDECIYTQIIPTFELISPAQLKISWSGTRVPRVQIYTKSLETEEYTLYGTYAWNRSSVTIPLADHSYYIMLKGNNDSGSSDTYLIGSSIQLGLEPELNMVSSTDKIYNIDIDYTSEYKIEVEY